MEFFLSLLRDFSPILAFGFFLGLFVSVLGHKLGLWRKELFEVGLCAWLLGGGGAAFLTIYRMTANAGDGHGGSGILFLIVFFIAGSCAVAASVPLAILVALGSTKRIAERAPGAALLVSALAAAAGFWAVERELNQQRAADQVAEAVANIPPAPPAPELVPSKGTRLSGFMVPRQGADYLLQSEAPYGPKGYQMKYLKTLPHPDGHASAVSLVLDFVPANVGQTQCDGELSPGMQIPGAEKFAWHGGQGIIYDVNASDPGRAKLGLDYRNGAGCLVISADFPKGEYSRAGLRNFLQDSDQAP